MVWSLFVGLRLVSLRSTNDSWTPHWDVKKRNYQDEKDFSKIALQHRDLLQLWLKHSDAWPAPKEGWECSRVSPNQPLQGGLAVCTAHGPQPPRKLTLVMIKPVVLDWCADGTEERFTLPNVCKKLLCLLGILMVGIPERLSFGRLDPASQCHLVP